MPVVVCAATHHFLQKQQIRWLFVICLKSLVMGKLRHWPRINTFVDGVEPAARAHGQIMVSLDNLVFLFGGLQNSGPTDELHAFDTIDLEWINLTPNVNGVSPIPRQEHSFSACSGGLFVFGGITNTDIYLNDLYLFDLSSMTWVNLTTVDLAPDPRALSAMVGVGEDLFLYGGRASSGWLLADLYRLCRQCSGSMWSNLTSAMSGVEPGPLAGAAMAALNDQLFLFAGLSSEGPRNALWKLDLVSLVWSRVDTGAAPPPHSRGALVAAAGSLFALGGASNSGERLNGLFRFNAGANNWTLLSQAPTTRAGMGLASVGTDLVVFGGVSETGALLTRLEIFHLPDRSWVSLSPNPLPPIAPFPSPYAVATSTAAYVWTFGGERTPGEADGSLLRFTVSNLSWQRLNTVNPPPRWLHGMVHVEERLVVFGGWSGEDVLGDLWVFSTAGDENLWTNITSTFSGPGSSWPAPRFGHGMSALNGSIVVFGGVSPKGWLNELLLLQELDGFWIWKDISAAVGQPSSRAHHGQTVVGGQICIFGGFDEDGILDDFYIFNMDTYTWSQLASVGAWPTPRAWMGIAGVDGSIFIYGGWTEAGVDDGLYNIDLSQGISKLLSQLIEGTNPGTRYGHVLTIIGDNLFIVGGFNNAGENVHGIHRVPRPRSRSWPLASRFMVDWQQIFDWDTIRLSYGGFLLHPLSLCAYGMPCHLNLQGETINSEVNGNLSQSTLMRKNNGLIKCTADMGCSGIAFSNIKILCDGVYPTLHESPLIVVEGADTRLVFYNCFIRGCRGGGILNAGGTVQLGHGASAEFRNSVFEAVYSQGVGGAIGVMGALLKVVDCRFVNCSSVGDGGAIHVVDSQCGAGRKAGIHIENTIFQGCVAGGAGGAISGTSSGSWLVVRSRFLGCMCNLSGGAINIAVFEEARNQDGVIILDSDFIGNVANGYRGGGGGVHLVNFNSTIAGAVSSGNRAEAGGGGFLLWQGIAPTLLCGLGAHSESLSETLEDSGSLNLIQGFRCRSCSPGKYKSEIGFISCSLCGAGTFSGHGASACVKCPPGTYFAGNQATSATVCTACPLGTFQEKYGASSSSCCLTCKAGRFVSASGASTCTNCPPGSASISAGSNSSAACKSCGVGTFSVTGFSSCQACKAGTYSSALGASFQAVCLTCAAGTFSSIGATVCQGCTVGSNAPVRALSTCLLCPAGSIAPRPSLASCEPCVAGTFASSAGSSACVACESDEHIPAATSSMAAGRRELISGSAIVCNSSMMGNLCREAVICYDPTCWGGEVFRNGMGGTTYHNLEWMSVKIAAPPFKDIALTMLELETEPFFDVLEVFSCAEPDCNPALNSTVLLARLSGHIARHSSLLVASEGILMLNWSSDACCPWPSAFCECPPLTNNGLGKAWGWSASFQVLGEFSCPSEARSLLRRAKSDVQFLQPKEFKNTTVFRQGTFQTNMLDKYACRSMMADSIKKLQIFDLPAECIPSGLETKGTQRLETYWDFEDKSPLMRTDKHQTISTQADSAAGNPRVVRREYREDSDVYDFCMPGDNKAKYGSCFASSFFALHLSVPPFAVASTSQENCSEGIGITPGQDLEVNVSKIDAYGSIIRSDSESIVEIQSKTPDLQISGVVMARLKNGQAIFKVTLKPAFLLAGVLADCSISLLAVGVDFLAVPVMGFTGVMRSSPMPLAVARGKAVCPAGSILSLEPPTKGSKTRLGTCQLCEPGKYSLNPLNSSEVGADPVCLTCPLGLECLGGDKVRISFGRWQVLGGILVLVECPAGHMLVNSQGAIWSQEVQHCQACNSSQYVLNFSSATCQDCPDGAICENGVLRGRVEGSVWVPDFDTGRYKLVSCPAGFAQVDSITDSILWDYLVQACAPCPQNFYCPGTRNVSGSWKWQCPAGLFAPTGSVGLSSCEMPVWVRMHVSLPVFNFTVVQETTTEQKLLAAMSEFTVVPTGRMTVSSKQQQRRHRGNLFVGTAERSTSIMRSDIRVGSQFSMFFINIAVKTRAEGDALAYRLADSREFNLALFKVGLPPGDLGGLIVDAGDSGDRELTTGQAVGLGIGCAALIGILVVAGVFISRCLRKHRDHHEFFMIQLSELRFDSPPQVLGRGALGVVHQAVLRGTPVAVKPAVPTFETTDASFRARGSIIAIPSELSQASFRVRNSMIALSSDPSQVSFRARNSLIILAPDLTRSSTTREINVNRLDILSETTDSPQTPASGSSVGRVGSKRIEPSPTLERAGSQRGGVDRSSSFNQRGVDRSSSLNCSTERVASLEAAAERVASLDIEARRVNNLRDTPESTACFASWSSSIMQSIKSFSKCWRSRLERRKRRHGSMGMETRDLKQLSAEMRLLTRLRHPCIATVMGMVLPGSNDESNEVVQLDVPNVVMELMLHGSLFDLLHNDTLVFEGDVLISVLRDIVKGMYFLHTASPPVIHGNLKSSNILVDDSFRAKVADICFERKGRARGNPLWMAPELLRGGRCTLESDVYGFGILLNEMFSRKLPYCNEDFDTIITQVPMGRRPGIPEDCPELVEAMMVECWHQDPAMRPGFDELDKRVSIVDLSDFTSHVLDKVRRKREAAATARAVQRANNVLYDVFPKHIAKALVAGRRVEPEHKEVVTIFFSDIVGFTTISAELPPFKVSFMLDRLYQRFDDLSYANGIFKVETIGDAWMGVTNLVDDQTSDHAARMARFAICAVAAANETLVDIENPALGTVQIRVGLHSGPVVASVVGARAPRYCLFGDTVNTASRMESNSQAGRVHCSDRAAAYIRQQAPDLLLKPRGPIEVKGKGRMNTFWVIARDGGLTARSFGSQADSYVEAVVESASLAVPRDEPRRASHSDPPPSPQLCGQADPSIPV